MTFPGSPRPGGARHEPASGTRGDRNVVALLAEMMMLPVTALLYGMELLVRAMQGTQGATEQGLNAIVGSPRVGELAGDQPDHLRGTGDRLRATSGSDGDPEPRPAQKEAATMDTNYGCESRRDRDLRDDTLKLVRYKILFVKRDHEVAFPEQEDLVYDNIDGTSFAAWKVAEFIQKMHNEGVRCPPRWQSRKYPDGADYFHGDGALRGLPEDDKKYLRVYYEVLDRYPREKFRHEEQQIRVLEQIRDRIRPGTDTEGATPPSSGSSGGPSSGKTGSGGTART